jgi:hypothetical protein
MFLFMTYDLFLRKHLIMNTFKSLPSQQKETTNLDTTNSKTIEIKKEDKVALNSTINIAIIGTHSKSQTPPFLLTFEIFNFNVHNSLLDSCTYSNVTPYSIFQKINVVPIKCTT